MSENYKDNKGLLLLFILNFAFRFFSFFPFWINIYRILQFQLLGALFWYIANISWDSIGWLHRTTKSLVGIQWTNVCAPGSVQSLRARSNRKELNEKNAFYDELDRVYETCPRRIALTLRKAEIWDFWKPGT